MTLPAAALPVEDTFPLVPRHRLHGLELGPFRGIRRGAGSDPAGSRPYLPGDDVRAIDWGASARLSAALGADEFVVRERYADLAPRVVVVSDRRAGMALHPPPWLSKPEALAACERLIGESALRARGLVGALHAAGGGPVWLPPTGNPRVWRSRPRLDGFDAPAGSLGAALESVAGSRSLGAGSFVFVLSDFLDPVPEEAWLRLAARGLDVVPVVIQDPTWEASFPDRTGGLVLPLADPESGRTGLVRLTAAEARERRERHERRFAETVALLAELGLDPVPLTSTDPDALLTAFVEWAAARLLPHGRPS